MSKSELRLVRVIWEDASVVDDGTWVSRDGLKKPEPVIFDQVGWLWELTPAHVVLCDCAGKELIAPRTRIPLGMVRSMREYAPNGGKSVKLPKVCPDAK